MYPEPEDLEVNQRVLLWAHGGAQIIQQSSQWGIESWRVIATLEPSPLQILHGLQKAIWEAGNLLIHLLKVSSNFWRGLWPSDSEHSCSSVIPFYVFRLSISIGYFEDQKWSLNNYFGWCRMLFEWFLYTAFITTCSSLRTRFLSWENGSYTTPPFQNEVGESGNVCGNTNFSLSKTKQNKQWCT